MLGRQATALRPSVPCARARRRPLRCCAGQPRADAAQPLRVVITGSTKGLGLALADEFLRTGSARVLVNSRDAGRVQTAVAQLQAQHGAARVTGFAADVAVAADVDALSSFAVEHFGGGVDVWLNNAGSNGYTFTRLVDTAPATIAAVVATNLLGTLLCTRAAALLMAKQEQGGIIFNMEGAGSDGGATPKYAAYGATKASLPQLTRSLQQEFADGRVAIHSLSPGMVKTELIDAGKDAFGAQGRFFVNALCEPPAYAASVLVPQIYALAALPRSTPSRKLSVLTPPLAAQKLLRRVVLGENKGRFYPEN